MNKDQIVTLSFFRYRGIRSCWRAFQEMGRAAGRLQGIPGLDFVKMLGSGGGNGFSIWPNFQVYGLLAVWQEEDAARRFFADHFFFQSLRGSSVEHWTVFLQTVMAQGAWEGQSPFAITHDFREEEPVAVLTRATIHPRHLWRFWRFVPRVSRAVRDCEGLLFSVGVGELPLMQQATFSLWQNSRLMKAYAYRSTFHKEVVRRTRQLGWYKEELFARFHPYASKGTWGGRDPLVNVKL